MLPHATALYVHVHEYASRIYLILPLYEEKKCIVNKTMHVSLAAWLRR